MLSDAASIAALSLALNQAGLSALLFGASINVSNRWLKPSRQILLPTRAG